MKPVCIISEGNGSRKDMEQGNVTEREEGGDGRSLPQAGGKP